MSHKIFISYRRQDTQSEAILLQNDLEEVFGEDSCFLDISDIHSGDKWIGVLEEQGGKAQICLVLMGKRWMELDAEGKPRLKDKNDWVRKEIEAAIQKGLTIIPVLVNGASLPQKTELPPKMQALLEHNAFEIRTNKWKTDVRDLIADIKRIIPAPNNNRRKVVAAVGLLALLAAISIAGISFYPYLFKESCPEFSSKAQLKTLFFPFESIDGTPQNYARQFETDFALKCQKYGVSFDNKFASDSDNPNLSWTDKVEIAKNCNADLFLQGNVLGQQPNISVRAAFGFTNDSIRIYKAGETFDLTLQNIQLNQLFNNESVSLLFDKVINYTIGFFAYRNGDFKTSLKALTDVDYSEVKNDSVKAFCYTLISEAFLEENQVDSSLKYLYKLEEIVQNPKEVTLKIALLSEKKNMPDVAIASYSKLIAQDAYPAEKLHERRADQFLLINDYSRAKEDYRKVKQVNPGNTEVNIKIRQVDKKILDNRGEINRLERSEVTSADRLRIAELYLQNGELEKAETTLNYIPTSTPEFQNAVELKLEAEVKQHKINPQSISVERLRNNKRLGAAVLQQ